MIPGVTKAEELLHAYLIEGVERAVLFELASFLENVLKVSVHGNPDVHIELHPTLSIENSRTLRERASRHALAGRKFFIVSFEHATREAQNALLKLFEEPVSRTHFFVIVPSAEMLLPTLRSRLMPIRHLTYDVTSDVDVKMFLKASKAKRLGLLKDIIDRKDKAAAVRFLESLEQELCKSMDKEKTRKMLAYIIRLRGYLHDRSPSVKMILEHLTLSL